MHCILSKWYERVNCDIDRIAIYYPTKVILLLRCTLFFTHIKTHTNVVRSETKSINLDIPNFSKVPLSIGDYANLLVK